MSLATANQGAAAHCKDFDRATIWQRLAAVVENIFPRKTALNFAAVAGVKERAAYAFLSGNSALSSDALLSLLRSEHGRETLEALMHGSDPQWWAEYRILSDEAQLRAKHEELEQRRKALREKP